MVDDPNSVRFNTNTFSNPSVKDVHFWRKKLRKYPPVFRMFKFYLKMININIHFYIIVEAQKDDRFR